jgi:hypothetical protein
VAEQSAACASAMSAALAATKAAKLVEEAATGQAAKVLGKGPCKILARIVAVRHGGHVERTTRVEVDGGYQPGDRAKGVSPGRGGAAGRQGERQRHPSPISETHGHSLMVNRTMVPSWSVRNRASGGRVRAVLRADHAIKQGRADRGPCRRARSPWLSAGLRPPGGVAARSSPALSNSIGRTGILAGAKPAARTDRATVACDDGPVAMIVSGRLRKRVFSRTLFLEGVARPLPSPIVAQKRR